MTPREGHQQKVNGSSHSHTLPRPPPPPCRSLSHLDFLQRFIRRLKRAPSPSRFHSLSVALKANREEMGRGNTCFLKSNNCKVKCLRTRGGGKWDKEGSREKCHRHGEKFCGRSSICPRLLKRRSRGGKEGSGTEPVRRKEV